MHEGISTPAASEFDKNLPKPGVTTAGAGACQFSDMAEVAAAMWGPVPETPERRPRKDKLPISPHDQERAVLLASNILNGLGQLRKTRHMACFALFFVIYATICNVQSDWQFASSTLSLLDRARADLGYLPFSDRVTVKDNMDFLDPELTNLTAELTKICRDCDVGVTSLAKSLSSFTLQDFVCSDFDSNAGSSDYPTRDCGAADAEYAAAPSATTAPCCGDATLVRASMSIMAWSSRAPELLEDNFLSGLRMRSDQEQLLVPTCVLHQGTGSRFLWLDSRATEGPVSVQDLLEIDKRCATSRA